MSWLLQPNVFLALVPVEDARDPALVGAYLDRAAGSVATGVWELVPQEDPRYAEALDSLLAGLRIKGHDHQVVRGASGILLVANGEGKLMLRKLAVVVLKSAGPPA